MSSTSRIYNRAASKAFASLLVVLFYSTFTLAARFPIIESVSVQGSGTTDFVSGIAYDPHGAILVSGSTAGSLGGPYQGATDAFAGKFDAAGQPLYISQFGTTAFDASNDVATDADGNMFVAGSTAGSLEGASAGNIDAFVRKFNSAGELQWTKQFGTSTSDAANGVAVDPSGNVWVTGQTDGALDGPSQGGRDSFVREYDTAGNLIFSKQWGTSLWDVSQAITTDPSGNAYITGFNTPALAPVDQQNFFVTKFDPQGNVVWTRTQGGPLLDQSTELTTDAAGNVYITGITKSQLGDTQFGSGDIFVAKYDPSGTLLWTKQYGTSLNENGFGIQVDASGNIFVGGNAANNPNGGPITASQGIVLSLDANGNERWEQILNLFPNDTVNDIALGEPGVVYALAAVGVTVNAPNGFLIAKIRDVSEEEYYDAWRSNFGASVLATTSADGNGDGVIDGADYVLWRSRVDQGSITGATSVPEPSAAALALIALFSRSRTIRRSRVGWFARPRQPILHKLLSAVLLALFMIGIASASEERTWTDTTGKFNITAELVHVENNQVLLRSSDGRELKVPLERLSDADRKFIAAQSPAHAASDKAVDKATDKATDAALAEIATRFYSDLRTPDRTLAKQSLTQKAASLMTAGQSPLAGLPQPQAGNTAIKVGSPKCEGDVAEIPVLVRAGGAVHKTKLHLRRDGDDWRVFAISATYPDGEKSINFEASQLQANVDPLQALLGKPLDVEGIKIDGKKLDMSKYQGKVVLVDFWATWCGPCRAEIPNIKENWDKHHDDGFDVIAISVDQDLKASARSSPKRNRPGPSWPTTTPVTTNKWMPDSALDRSPRLSS